MTEMFYIEQERRDARGGRKVKRRREEKLGEETTMAARERNEEREREREREHLSLLSFFNFIFSIYKKNHFS